MRFYLDTCHIQSLVTSNEPKIVKFRETFLGKNTLILSLFNIEEILNRTDKNSIIEIANFFKNINIRYLKNPIDLAKEEILSKYSQNNISPCTEKIRDLYPFKNLELFMRLGNKSIFEFFNDCILEENYYQRETPTPCVLCKNIAKYNCYYSMVFSVDDN